MEAAQAKFGIYDEDIYNFDEAGFMMGIVSSQLVVTGSHRRGRPKLVQPGNQTWTTVIQGVGAGGGGGGGGAIPPISFLRGRTTSTRGTRIIQFRATGSLGSAIMATNSHGIE